MGYVLVREREEVMNNGIGKPSDVYENPPTVGIPNSAPYIPFPRNTKNNNQVYDPSWGQMPKIKMPSLKKIPIAELDKMHCKHQWFELKKLGKYSEGLKKTIEESRKRNKKWNEEHEGQIGMAIYDDIWRTDVFGVLVKCANCLEERILWEEDAI